MCQLHMEALAVAGTRAGAGLGSCGEGERGLDLGIKSEDGSGPDILNAGVAGDGIRNRPH